MKKRRLLKSIIAVACAVLMTVFMASCAAQSDTVSSAADASASADGTSYTETTEAGTLTGEIISIEGSNATVQLGEISENGHGGPPDMSSDSEAEASEMSADSNGTPPEMPSDSNGTPPEIPSDSNGTPPEMPSDSNGTPPEMPSDSNGTPPEMPSDSNGAPPEMPSDSNGTPPEMPGNSGTTFTAGSETGTMDLSGAVLSDDSGISDISELKEGDIITVEYDENGSVSTVTLVDLESGSGNGPQGEAPEGAPGGGQSSEIGERSAAATIDSNAEISGESYTSTGDDENALLVDGAEVTLTGITVDKQSGSSSNAENGDFYGMNAALLAVDGAQVTIDDSTVTSSAQCGNGVFSYGEGTVVNVSDTSITTQGDNSGGIMTTGGGTMNAENLTVTTSGNSAAAIRSDRGGGTVNVTGGTYTSKGYNSPAIYSTADITVTDATLTAENSEALVIEGQNSIDLTDCTVSGNMSDTKGASSDENVHCIFIYQSMSGDAENGTAEFSMNGGTVINNNGDVFYVTNTACTIDLNDVEIVNNETDGYLMLISGNSASHGWGSAGSNGAQAVVTATDQQLEGDIAVDTISSLDLTLSGSSVLTGTVNIIDNAEGGTSDSSEVNVTVDNGSTWILTGNCTVTTLTNNGTIDFNGYTITLADGTVLS